ncbi:MAG: hypothetical protein IPH76_15775 [Xanthomonadales bacterium]|nr:hypothetical protein [Xanthomonadales bacterium]
MRCVRRRFGLARWPLIGLLLTPVSTLADTIVVGSGAGCTHSSLATAFLAAAVSSGSDTLIITANQTHTGAVALNLTNEGSVTIRGGVSCADTAEQQRDITATQGDLFEFVNTHATVRKLRLISDVNGGRPLTASGSSLITLDDGAVLNAGKAGTGRNLYLSGGASLVMLSGSMIWHGAATFDGGGVYCTGAGTVAIADGALIRDNTAACNGGGIYAASGCTVNLSAGGPSTFGATIFEGVWNNHADFNGGGIYTTTGANVNVLGSSAEAASVRDNIAEKNGGGIYATGAGTRVEILSAEIVDNLSYEDGGGLYVGAGADLLMDRDLASCARAVRCSLLEGNSNASLAGVTSEGGAIYVAGGATAAIRQTYVTGNTSLDEGNVALVDGSDSYLLLEGGVLYDNAGVGTHVFARNGGHARVAFSSLWGSSTPGLGMYLLQAGNNGRVDLYSSLAVEGFGQAPTGGGPDKVFGPAGSGGQHFARCAIAHETGSLPVVLPTTYLIETDPAQVWSSPATGDPHLRADSDAIDYCDTSGHVPVDRDIDNEVRGLDDLRCRRSLRQPRPRC